MQIAPLLTSCSAQNLNSVYIGGSTLGNKYDPKISHQTRSLDFGKALPLLPNGLSPHG